MVQRDRAPAVVVRDPSITDNALWRDAWTLMDRHSGPDARDKCSSCRRRWPCPPRRMAESARRGHNEPARIARALGHVLNEPHTGRYPPVDRSRYGGEARGWRRQPNQRADTRTEAGYNRGLLD